ncbi:MAG: flagellar hook-basal body protein [Methyloversatilis sp.]|jgi:flagellar basal-body rod protein FlgG|nr:flagellar hook-basal body protein [Methyloversatilis sp.]
MLDPITLTLASMQNDMQRMNLIANNAANALTPGFKREFGVIAGQVVDRTAAPSGLAASAEGIPLLGIRSDDRPGTPRQTGNPLDVALLGEGYFEVRTPDGFAYTRTGAWRLDADGRVVTEAGHAVMGTGGEIVLTSPTPKIGRDGRIFDGTRELGRLKVVTFEAGESLSRIGGGLLVPHASSRHRVLDQPRVAQAHLEASNVDSAREMVQMMETFRHFEQSSRVLQAYDQVRDKVFTSLGQF